MVCDLIERTLYDRVFVNLLEALQAESVAARQGQRLFLAVVVGLEADSTFKYRFHLTYLFNYIQMV